MTSVGAHPILSELLKQHKHRGDVSVDSQRCHCFKSQVTRIGRVSWILQFVIVIVIVVRYVEL